jgi:uncharacterized membrane protein
MRAPILFLLLLSFPALAFSDSASASPPPVPQTGGLVALQALLADGMPVVGMPLVITATKADGATTTYRLITGREGNVLLTLDKGSYVLNCVLDSMATDGADYAATTSLTLPGPQNMSLVFYPAGSVAVTALEGGQVVPDASMHVSCASDWFDLGELNGADPRAGAAGDFIFRALPAGPCVVSASTQTSAGSVQVDVGQGKLESVQLELKPKALALSDIALVLAAILAAILLAYYLLFRKKGQPETAAAPVKKAMKETKLHKPAPILRAQQKISAFDVNGEKARAVLSTLSEREDEIVRFLCASGGKAKRSTMQHKLLIPKTSLLRNLRALERKRIVKLIPFGRNLVAELARELFE